MFRQVKPYFSIVCPCDLLMIIAKAGLIGNCFLMRSKGSLTSARYQRPSGNENLLPNVLRTLSSLLPVAISASMTRLCIPLTTNLVPFAMPLLLVTMQREYCIARHWHKIDFGSTLGS